MSGWACCGKTWSRKHLKRYVVCNSVNISDAQYVDISQTGKLLAYKYLLHLLVSRRNEMKADYIGLLLLASAGYDPMSSSIDSTHPSGKKRAKLLSQDKVMEEALGIYRESNSGRGIEGFL
ncbi:hypothetical protein MKX01_041437 [Papaver californicum]|nr:hypothetical protein MKX01_041437 [Papaver californicum]